MTNTEQHISRSPDEGGWRPPGPGPRVSEAFLGEGVPHRPIPAGRSGAAALGFLVLVDVVLIAADVLLSRMLGHTPKLFDLNGEGNIPAWWSSAQLLVSGILVAIVALRNGGKRLSSGSLFAFSGLLVLMSLDETASFHERLGTLLDSFLDRTGGVLPRTGYWPLLLGLPLATLVLALLRRCGSQLEAARPRSARRFGLALLVLFSGAIGVELFNNVASLGLLRLAIELEEGLEMLGGSLLLASALDLVSGVDAAAGQLWAAERSAVMEPVGAKSF